MIRNQCGRRRSSFGGLVSLDMRLALMRRRYRRAPIFSEDGQLHRSGCRRNAICSLQRGCRFPGKRRSRFTDGSCSVMLIGGSAICRVLLMRGSGDCRVLLIRGSSGCSMLHIRGSCMGKPTGLPCNSRHMQALRRVQQLIRTADDALRQTGKTGAVDAVARARQRRERVCGGR